MMVCCRQTKTKLAERIQKCGRNGCRCVQLAALSTEELQKMGIKIKAGSRRMAHFLPAWCECLPQRLCSSPRHSFMGRSFYSPYRCRHELPVFDVINETPDCRIRNFLGADYVSIFRTLEAVKGILIYPNRFVVDDVA